QESSIEIRSAVYLFDLQLDIQRSCGFPNRIQLHGPGVGIPQYGDARELWIALDQHLHPLRSEVRKVEEYASDVAPWSGKASCHTAGDRVRFQIDCDNWNAARGRSSRIQYRGAARHDHAHILRNDFRYQRSYSRRVTFRRSAHNLDLGGSGVAGSPQAAQDRLEPKSHYRLGALIYKTDSGDFRRLLRSRSKRPRNRRTGQQLDEFSTPHLLPRAD